jgi:hypothetical protein
MPRRTVRAEQTIESAGRCFALWVKSQWKMILRLRDPSDFERINGMLLYVDRTVKW